MARNEITNILLRIAGEDTGAQKTLAELAAELQAFGNIDSTATAEVKVKGSDKLLALAAQLKAVTGKDYRVGVGLDVQQRDFATLVTELTAIAHRSFTVPVEVHVAKNAFAQFEAALRAFTAQRPNIGVDLKLNESTLATVLGKIKVLGSTIPPVDVPVEVAAGSLAKVLSELNAVTHQSFSVPVKLALDKGSLVRVQTAITAIGAQDVNIGLAAKVNESSFTTAFAKVAALSKAISAAIPKVGIDVKTDGVPKTVAELTGIAALANHLDGKNVNINVGTSSFALARAAISGFVGGLQALTQNAGTALKGLGESLAGTTVNLGIFGTKLGPVIALVLAMAVAVGVSLVGALGLLVTAIASAAAAVGGLAAAFAAALGPAVLVGIAAITKIASIFKIVSNLDKAKADAARQSAAGTGAASAAEETRHNRLITVRDALAGVTSAERNLGQARDSAKQQIIDANRAQQQAAQSLQDANQQLKTSTVDAYRAMAQAARDATSALLGVKSARLSVDEASLAVKQAALDLKEFRNASNTAGNSLNSLFKKFTDVNFKGSVAQGLQGVGVSQKDSLKGEGLILALRRAKLNEQQATLGLKNSEDQLTQARQRQIEFTKKGIAAFQPYVSALRGVRDATDSVAQATITANKLNAQGVAGNPQVVAAVDAVTAAHRRLAEAKHNAALPVPVESNSVAAAKKAFDDLTPAEKAFARLIEKIRVTWKQFKKDVGSSIFDGVTKGARHFLNILSSAQVAGPLLGLAKTLGDTFNAFFKSFDNKASKDLFKSLINGSAALLSILGSSVFPEFINLFLRVAAAFMPHLVAGTDKFGKSLKNVNKNLSDKDLANFASGTTSALSGLLGLAKQVGRIFLNFFKGSSKDSGSFIKSLTSVAKHFADFLGSKKGQKAIHDFFKDTVPLVLAFGKAMFQLINFFIKFTQIVAPAATLFFNGFALILAIINKILAVLRPFLQIALEIGAVFIGVGTVARLKSVPILIRAIFSVFVALFDLVKKLFSFLGDQFGKLPGIASAAFNAVTGAAGTAITAVGDAFGKLPGIASKVFHVITGAGETALKAIGTAFNHLPTVVAGAFGKIKTLVTGVLDFLKTQFFRVGHFIAEGFRAGVAFIRKIIPEFFDFGVKIIQGLIDGIGSMIGKLGKTIGDIAKSIGGVFGKILNFGSPSKVFEDFGKNTIQGFINGLEKSKAKLSATVEHTIAPVVRNVDTSTNVRRPRSGALQAAVAGAGASTTTIGDIILQTPEGGTPDGLTAARKLKRELKKRG